MINAEKKYGTLVCRSHDECVKTFKLTQLYIDEVSDMKLQVATDSIVETYTPNDLGKIGAKATLKPGKGASETVKLIVGCGGVSSDVDNIDNFKYCADKIVNIYKEFPKYINDALR